MPPNEMIVNGIELINADLAEELLNKISKNTPEFFEKLVLDLLFAIRYGERRVTGRSGNGGIDGFISQDTLVTKKYISRQRDLQAI